MTQNRFHHMTVDTRIGRLWGDGGEEPLWRNDSHETLTRSVLWLVTEHHLHHLPHNKSKSKGKECESGAGRPHLAV